MRRFYLLAIILYSNLLGAATATWQGATNSMNLGSNWIGGSVPTAGDDLIFPASASFSKPVLNNLPTPPFSIGNLTISDIYNITGGGFVLGGTCMVSGVAATGATLNNGISGAGSFSVTTGTLILSNTNTYTGTTAIGSGGIFKAGSGNAFSTASNVSIASGAILNLNNFSNTIKGLSGVAGSSIALGNAVLTVTNTGTVDFPGVISANAAGAGFALGAGSTGIMTLSGANSYSSTALPGSTTVTAGTLRAGSATAFGLSSNLSVALGATIDLNGFNNTFGTLAGAGTITFGSATLTCSQGGSFSGTLGNSGTGGLILGAGTLTLTGGTSSYTGTTTLGSGSVLVVDDLGTSGALIFSTGSSTLRATMPFTFSNAITLSGTGTFDTNGNAVTLGGAISGPGAFNKSGAGTLTVNGTNNYSGRTDISGGTFEAGSTSAISPSSSVGLTGSSILDLDSNSNSIVSLKGAVGTSITLGSATLTLTGGSVNDAFYGVISEAGNVEATGGTVTMMKTNTYTGTTTISGGATYNTLDLGSTSGVVFGTGGGSVEFGSGVTSSATFTIDGPAILGSNTFNSTLSGAISNGGTPNELTKLGLGTLTLTGANTNKAQITISGGVLNLNAASLGVVATGPTEILFDTFGGILQAGSALTIDRPITLSAAGTIDTNSFDVSISGPISTANPFTKTGTGTLTLTGTNTYAAKTTVKGGILNVIRISYPTASQLVFQEGTGGIFGTFQIDEPFTSTNKMTSSVVFMANGTIDTNSHDMEISGVVAGLATNAFTKAGVGTLTLSGANIYKGATNVTGGTLKAGIATGNSGAFGVDSDVTVSAGATLDFSTFANSVASLSNAGTLLSSATITTGTFTQTAAGATTFNFPSTTASPVGNVTATGTMTLGSATPLTGGTLTVTSTGGYSGGPSDEIILFQSSGAGKQLIGSFATTTVPFGKISYDYSNNQVILGASSTACHGVWSAAANGNWAALANWTSCVPGLGTTADHDTATFGDTAAGTVSVALANSGGTAAQSVILHKLDFNSTATAYTINQFSGMGTITLDSVSGSSDPQIHIISGSHTINAPIVLTKDSNITISSGTLTLGSASTITSPSGVFKLSEGAGSGALINNGSITPSSLLLEGNTITNNSTISPTGALTIRGLTGSSGVSLNNTMTLSSGGTFTVGGAGAASTALTNSAAVSSASTFDINSGTVTNNSPGTISSTDTFTIAGGTVINNSGATLGSNTADLLYTTGSLTSSDQLLAKDYTQNSAVGITLNFPAVTATPVGNLSATGEITLAGTLTVTNTGGYSGGPSEESILFQSSGTGKQLFGSFAFTTVPFGKISYDYSNNQVTLNASSTACNGTWSAAANGNWATMANWASCVPGLGVAADHDTATFGDTAAGTVAVALANSGGTAAQSVILHKLDFNSTATSYTINQFSGMGTITLDSALGSSDPQIHVISGTHTIDAPIVLTKDSNITISAGTLTLGSASTITSPSGTFKLSEGAGSGTLINNGSITPSSLLLEGNTITNNSTISPTGALTIRGLAGSSGVSLNNTMTLSSGGAFTLGAVGSATTTLTNSGTVTSASTLDINSGTVTNNSPGMISSTGIFTIAGGTVINNSGATLGVSASNLIFSGGTLVTQGAVLANNYTQGGTSILQTNVFSTTNFGSITTSGVATLDGTLIVNALPNFAMTNGQSIDLVTSVDTLVTKFSNINFENFPSTIVPTIIYNSNTVELDIRELDHALSHGAHTSVAFNMIQQHNQFLNLRNFQMRSRMPQSQTSEIAANHLPFTEDELLASNSELMAQQSDPVIFQKERQQAQKMQGSTPFSTDPWNVYIGPVGSFGDVKSKGDQIGARYKSIGGLAGFDYVLDDVEERRYQLGWGAAFEYRKIWNTLKENNGSTTIDRVHGSLYGVAVPKATPALAIEGIAGFGYNWDDLERKTGVNQKEKATANTHEKIGTLFLGFEYSFSQPFYAKMPERFAVIPFLTWQYIVDRISTYKEKGAGQFNLKVDGETLHSFSSMLGSRFTYLFGNSNYNTLAQLNAGWAYEYLNRSLIINYTAFNSNNTSFGGKTVAPGRNSLILAGDLLSTFPGGWQIEANCTYQLNSLYYDFFFYLGFGRVF